MHGLVAGGKSPARWPYALGMDPAVAPKKSSRRKTFISLAVGLIVMAAVFFFIFPKLGDYGKAFATLRQISPWWPLHWSTSRSTR